MTAQALEKRPSQARDDALETPQAAPSNPVHDDIRRIAAAYGAVISDAPDARHMNSTEEDLLLSNLAAAIAPKSPAEACLVPFLAAVGWTGVARDVKEALPHFDRIGDVEALRSVLAKLNLETHYQSINFKDLAPSNLPCLFSSDGLDVKVVVDRSPSNEFLLFDGASGNWRLVAPISASGFAYSIISQPPEPSRSNGAWLFNVIRRFTPIIWKVFLLNFLINLSALALPLFVMQVYNLGIGARAIDVVLYLALGALIVIATDQTLRRFRAYAVSYLGARLDAIIAAASFQQLLQMPISLIESAPITVQIARLRQFESIRDVFTGTLATAIIDMPFILIFLAAIGLIGGTLVWIPASLVAAYGILAAITIPVVRTHLAKTGEAKVQLQRLLFELISKRSAIRDVNGERVWIARHDMLVNLFARRNFISQLFDGFIQSLSQTLVTLAGILTLGFGTLSVISGAMSTGGLIGVMILVWRVLSPLQITFLALTRLEQAVQTFKHVNRLMEMAVERSPGQRFSFHRKFTGRIDINRLVFRHPRSLEPTLRGIELQIMPGEVIAFTGRSGSGKSTLLKLVAGLYPATAGAILADGIDIRQLDPAEWRSAIAFAPQTASFFYGTISQNIQLACPEATQADIARAADEMGLTLFKELFPEGLETRLSPALLDQLPDAIKQRLLLARCFVKDAFLYLLDRPEINLDDAGNLALVAKIANLRARATVMFTTHRPSHMLLADRVVVLDGGQIVMQGPAQAVVDKLNAMGVRL